MSKQAILKIFNYLFSKYIKLQLLCTLIGFLFGFAAVLTVVKLTKSDSYSTVGTLIAMFMFILGGIILSAVSFTTDFINAVKMNVTRSNYIFGAILYYTVVSIIGAGLTLLYRLETVMADIVYNGGVSLEPSLGMLFNNAALPVLGICLIMIVLGTVTGAVSLKFGNKGFLTVYFIFIFGANILPRYLSQTAETMKNIAFVDSFINAGTPIKIMLVAIIALAATGVSIRVLMKNDIPT